MHGLSRVLLRLVASCGMYLGTMPGYAVLCCTVLLVLLPQINLAGEELDPDAPAHMRPSQTRGSLHPTLWDGSQVVKRSAPSASREDSSSSSGIASGRVAAAVAALNTPPSNSKTAERPADSRSATTPGSNSSSSRLKDATSGTAMTSIQSGRDVAADNKEKQPGRSSCNRLKPLAPAHLQISAKYDENLEESDIESPKVDSPTKAAAKHTFAVHSAKQQAATVSPAMAVYGKQSLSLRASRKEVATSRGAASDVRKELPASPVKIYKHESIRSRESISKVYDHSGIQMMGQGNSGRGGSPTKTSRADKISLRPAKPVVR